MSYALQQSYGQFINLSLSKARISAINTPPRGIPMTTVFGIAILNTLHPDRMNLIEVKGKKKNLTYLIKPGV